LIKLDIARIHICLGVGLVWEKLNCTQSKKHINKFLFRKRRENAYL